MDKLAKLIRKKVTLTRKRNRIAATITGIGGLFVFITVYTLILPALALEDKAYCGMEAHQHGEACYQQVLTCDKEEHTHTDQCYDDDGNLICEMKEHSHDQDCYKNELVCGKEKHIHDESCYSKPEPEEITKDSTQIQEEITEASAVRNDTETGTTKERNTSKKKSSTQAKRNSGTAEKTESTQEKKASDEKVSLTSFMSDRTGLWLQNVKEDQTVQWTPMDKDTTLAKEDLLRIHLAFKLPRKTVKDADGSSRSEYIYKLPENIIFTQETADWHNDDINAVNQVITGTAVPDKPSQSEEYLAGKYQLIQDEKGRWELVITWDPYIASENRDKAVNVWTELYITGASLKTDKDIAASGQNGKSGSHKIVFAEKTKKQDEISVPYAGMKTDKEDKKPSGKDADADTKVKEEPSADTKDKKNTEEKAEKTITAEDADRQELTYKGKDYTINLSYGKEAGIPEDVKLSVREIREDSAKKAEQKEFNGYLKESAKKLGVKESEVSFARFFDIELEKDGKKIEPEAPVQVDISYKKAVDTNEFLNIVHFADEGTEVISDLNVNENGKEISYEQDSFSVTGTIQTGNPTNGGIYMIIVEYNGKHYMVNNDGTLSEIAYGQDANGTIDDNKVSVEYPMFWTYYYQYGGHLRFASEASGFNADQTASGYYYKYINPNDGSGIAEENKNGAGTNLLGQTVITYHDKTISDAGYSKYIGVVNDGGVLRISGNVDSAHAAKIELATPSNVLPSDPLKHSVNHIDIGIDGAADVKVPLAYGTYTYTDGNGIRQTITVDQEHLRDVMLHAGKNEIQVTSEDMKGAEIKAYKKSDYEQYKNNPEELANHELNDVFYITGYSANDTTDFSEVQVRVEGSFKVAYGIEDANWNYYSWWNGNYINQVKRNRLDNQVEYTVSLDKTITLPVLIDGKYQLYDQDGTPMSVTVTVPLKDSFSYWDRENECPPVQWDWNNWQSGDIATHGMSGMDFRLDGGTVNVQADIVAINITKYIEDTNGNPIRVGTAVNNSFEVYQDKDGDPDSVKTLGSENVDYSEYAYLHSRDVTINAGSDQNIVHDYQVTPGMYYIREKPESVAENNTITDTSGQQWKYKGTEILTEYVWRGGASIGLDDKGRVETVHQSSTYTGKASDSYNSIPDALGPYTVDGSSKATDNEGVEWDLNNGFLEFYVINKYEKVQGEIPEPSQDSMNIQLEKKWDDNGDSTPPSDSEASVKFLLHQIKKTTTTTSTGSGTQDGTKVVLYDIDDVTPLAEAYAKPGDTLSLNFKTKTGNIGTNVHIKNQTEHETSPSWKYFGHIQSDGNGNVSQNISYTFNSSDIVNELISFRLADNNLDGSKFASGPTWTGATGSAGAGTSVDVQTVEDPEGYPKEITLTTLNDWKHTFQNLITREVIPAENKTIEYSYYLEEDAEQSTGGAREYSAAEFRVSSDENFSSVELRNASDSDNAVTGSAETKYVEVTNKKSSLTVEKEWRGEEDTDAYPPIKFKLYQGWKNGDTVSQGWIYTEETNHPTDSNHIYTINANGNWKMEFYNLPTTATHEGQTGAVGYYVVEVDPQDGTSWFNNPNVKTTYKNSNDKYDNSGNQPYNAGLAGNTGTLTIINTMPKYKQLEVQKKWYENHNGSWSDISENSSKTSDYAFGFMVQRQVQILDGQTVLETIPYEDYGSEILVSQNQVLINDNDFNVDYGGSLWLFKVQGNDDITRHENNLVGEGYYQKKDGSRVWAKFTYRFVETDAYKLSTVMDGTTVKPKDQWETMACNPTYETSGDRAVIKNYPIGEMDVTKIWNNEDPDLDIGSKVYFKVFQNNTDISSDIVEHPSKYGLYSNQVYHDPDHPEHDSVVITYNGSAWDIVKVKGLNIFDLSNNSSQYQYSVQEIGYSDQKNQDFWDVSAFLKGYMIDNPEGNPSTETNGRSTSVASDPVKTVYIKNEYVKTETEYEFTKVWQDSTGGGISWQEPITVTLYQTKGDVAAGTDTPTGKTATFTINPYGVTGEGNPVPRTFTFDGKTYEWSMEVSHEGSYYTIRIDHLPYKDSDKKILSYYVTEEALGGYINSYAFKEDETDPDLTIKVSTNNQAKTERALDGQFIINKQQGIELPSTGGTGTNLIYILGLMLTVIAGTGLLLFSRRKYQ